ncbi:prephenate dehydrogenase [Thiobacter aerophilum]|uniref:Prephenate dehydrogenase/arogenate dehydrogenase family protein n=1 Tax=Thiobacter aerophilum TaxID=3121275 RepID=A0ABV0EFI1_9BURK
MIGQLVVFGVGLIGGSFALALRQAGMVRHIVGFGRSAENLAAARAASVIDEIGGDPAAVRDADLVALAVPVGQMGALLAAIAPHLGTRTVVTDMGSTKQNVVALARAHLGAHLPRFVPGHPIAGAEKSGVEAARADLFQQRTVILTPLPETDPAACRQVAQLWAACGAQVAEMTAAEHDALFAAVSHLPHVLAFALVDYIAQRADGARLFSFAASGFRDFTRIAASSPEMWRDICLANGQALLREIAGYEAELARIKGLIEAGDGAALLEVFRRARDAREAWLKGQ